MRFSSIISTVLRSSKGLDAIDDPRSEMARELLDIVFAEKPVSIKDDAHRLEDLNLLADFVAREK